VGRVSICSRGTAVLERPTPQDTRSPYSVNATSPSNLAKALRAGFEVTSATGAIRPPTFHLDPRAAPLLPRLVEVDVQKARFTSEGDFAAPLH
jgi:hypothetical protein